MDEGGSLENCSPGDGTVGSNPTPSAKIKRRAFTHKLYRNKRDVSSVIGEVAERLKAVGC